MPTFKVISNDCAFEINNTWVDATKFNSKDRIVNAKGKAISADYQGHQYRIIAKKEHVFSNAERVGRGLLGTLAVVCTLFLALISKSIKNLFVTPKQSIRFGIRVIPLKLTEKNNSNSHKPESPLIIANEKTKDFQTKTINCTSENQRAAVIIQKHIRGYLARRPLLSNISYPQYHEQCVKAKDPKSNSMPRAQGGTTVVYLPQDRPEIILKYSGRQNAVKRFHQMQEVRSVLDSQNSSHLIIPKAALCQDFLVEQRLPINTDSYHNMELYLSQPQLFHEAVRELTRLFSKMHLSDLIGFNLPLSRIVDSLGNVRYDNLPFYLVEKNGKIEAHIGLIDLEHIHNIPNTEGLATLARIFPYHLEIIKDEANKLKMDINNELLAVSAEKGKKFLQVGFSDHLRWLKNKRVSPNDALQPFEISPQRIIDLTNFLKNVLLKLNQGINDVYFEKGFKDQPPKDFFTQKPEEVSKELAASILPLIIDSLKSLIESEQAARLNKLSGQHMTESEIVSIRSPLLKRHKLYKNVQTFLSNSTKIKFQSTFRNQYRDMAEQISNKVMQELVKGGELFFYDPAYYTGGHDICWLRY